MSRYLVPPRGDQNTATTTRFEAQLCMAL